MYNKILVPIDLHEEGCDEHACSVAVQLAKVTGAEIHLLTVIPAGPAVVAQFLPGGYEKQVSGQVESELDKLVSDMGLEDGKVVTNVRFGGVYQEILAYAEKIGADLIVVGSHQPGVADYLLGSNAARVARHASCSVLVVRRND